MPLFRRAVAAVVTNSLAALIVIPALVVADSVHWATGLALLPVALVAVGAQISSVLLALWLMREIMRAMIVAGERPVAVSEVVAGWVDGLDWWHRVTERWRRRSQ